MSAVVPIKITEAKSDLLLEEMVSPTALTIVRKHIGRRIALSLVIFIPVFLVVSFTIGMGHPARGFTSVGILLAAYFSFVFKYLSPLVEVTVDTKAISEFRAGNLTDSLPFSEMSSFGFMKDSTGDAWIRISFHSGRPPFRYVPKLLDTEKRDFLLFGERAQRAVESYNRENPDSPIRTGLSKSEKTVSALSSLFTGKK